MHFRRVLSFVIALPVGALSGLASTAVTAPAAVWAQTRPMVEHIEPTSGPPGTRVRIVGRGFRPAYRVLFNEHPVAPEQLLPERITVVVPANGQTGRFVLSNGDDEVETEVFRVTAPEPAPVLTAIEPATASPGAEVVLRGDHFAARPADNVVRLGELPMVVRSGDSTTLRVIVPGGASTGPVFVRTPGGEARSATDLTVNTALVVREFVPRAAPPGSRVVLRGSGFSATATANQVTLRGRPARVVRASPTELEVEVPLDGQTGTLVVNVQGVGRYETASALVVGLAPVLRAFEPAQGATGARVAIRGERFGTDASRVQVTLAGRPVTLGAVAPGELTVTVPQGATSGRFAITVDGVGPIESTTDFTVLEPLTLARFEPRTGEAGDRITLTGTGFSPTITQDTVVLNTTPATVVSATPTELVVQVPAEASSGPWHVTVAGNGTVHTRQPFMISRRPRITAIDPPAGIPGQRVTLRGVNFPVDRPLLQVRLNGQEVAIESLARDALVVTVPRNAQTGRFQVVARLQGTGVAETDFQVLSPVTLREVSPPAGPVGAEVTLRGEGFEPDVARVRLRLGERAIVPARASTTEVVFAVPRGARDGVITLEADGRQPVASPQPFAVTVPPTVQSVAPAHAPAGASITVRGRNFGTVPGNVEVRLGDQPCAVTSVTPTAVVCTLPEGAQTGRITVRVTYAGEASARAPFRVDARR